MRDSYHAVMQITTLEDILKKEIPAYYTAKEVAAIMRVDSSTIRRHCELGRYERAFKHGSDWRIPSRFFEKQLLMAEERGEFSA